MNMFLSLWKICWNQSLRFPRQRGCGYYLQENLWGHPVVHFKNRMLKPLCAHFITCPCGRDMMLCFHSGEQLKIKQQWLTQNHQCVHEHRWYATMLAVLISFICETNNWAQTFCHVWRQADYKATWKPSLNVWKPLSSQNSDQRHVTESISNDHPVFRHTSVLSML